jgi:hypothetical protein
MGFITLVFSLESVITVAFAAPREGTAYADAAKKKKKTTKKSKKTSSKSSKKTPPIKPDSK